MRKPDARAYRAVEVATGRAGQRILFFDDREENVSAARQCQWTATLIDHAGDAAAQMLERLTRLDVGD